MSSGAVIMLILKVSLALTVLGVGLQSKPGDATYLLRRRGLLARSFLAMNVLMPLLAVWVTIVFTLRPAVTLALVALAISPVPPFLPSKAGRAEGHRAYVTGLFVTASLAAVVVVPLSVWLLGLLFGVPFQMSPLVVAKLVGVGILLPVGIGMATRRFAPRVAERIVGPVSRVAPILLVAALIPLLVTAWPSMRLLIGNGTLLAIVVMTVIGLFLGHWLGGPDGDDRTVLALATASRHPAVAISILAANFPGERQVTAAVLLTLLVGALASAPYTAWSKRRNGAWAHRPGHSPAP